MTESGVFVYRALRRDGSVVVGHLEAASATEADAALSGRALFLVELRAEAATRDRRAAISVDDLALGLRMLADLLDAGLPVTRALHTFEELAPNGWRPALPHVRQAVKEGKSLATALATAPIEVPALVLGIARAGEAGSGIGPAIRRAAEAMEGAASTRAAVKAALAYPIILAIAGTASVGTMVGVVLPRFAVLLADLNHELPPATRMLLAVVASVRALFLPSLGLTVAAFVAWTAWVGTVHGRARWHAWLLGVPLIGSARQAGATARAATAMAALLDSGVPVVEAMKHAARATGDAALEERLLRARDAIASGVSIAAALRDADAASGTVVRLVRAGEETGRLAGMLAHAARLEQERSDRLVKSSVRLLEPVLVLIFAAIVALVAAALLQAVYSVRPTA